MPRQQRAIQAWWWLIGITVVEVVLRLVPLPRHPVAVLGIVWTVLWLAGTAWAVLVAREGSRVAAWILSVLGILAAAGAATSLLLGLLTVITPLAGPWWWGIALRAALDVAVLITAWRAMYIWPYTGPERVAFDAHRHEVARNAQAAHEARRQAAYEARGGKPIAPGGLRRRG